MDIFYQLRWQDILDILLVAVILYWLLLLIKGTKAAQILIGLVVLFFAFLLSGYIGLYTMDWLIQSFWAQIVLVLVILFQPEIRRALAQMGEARFLPSFASAEELKSLEEIVRGTIALSNRKIGGLIVIERETSLRDFIEIVKHIPSHIPDS
jgi:diadenylate cyclase